MTVNSRNSSRFLFATTVLVLISIVLLVSNYPDADHSDQDKPLFFDGPDKALAHNNYMIRDISENRVPYERLHAIRSNQNNLRVSESGREFNWQQISTNIPGRSRAMLYHSPTQTLFSGSVTGGLWKNSDYKSDAAWSLVPGFEGSAVNCLAQDPNNPSKLFIGTGESFTAFVNYRESTGLGNGIYFSTDVGVTWNLIESTSDFYYINDLVVRDEDGSSVIYAAVGSGEYRARTFVQEGLYRSDDQGETWSQVLPTLPESSSVYQISDLEIAGDGKIYASTMRNSENLGGSMLLSSTNGTEWAITDLNALVLDPQGDFAGRSIVKAAPSNPDHVYVVTSSGFINGLDQLRDYNSYLWQSIDGGTNWEEIPLPRYAEPNQGQSPIFSLPWHAMALAVDPNDENKVIAGGVETYVLNNASSESITALDWIQLSYWAALYYAVDPDLSAAERQFYAEKYVHADIHDIQFVDANSNELLITTDGGVHYTSSMGLTNNIDPENPIQNFPIFNTIHKSQNTGQFYHASIHPTKGKMEAVGGTQDNGSIHRIWTNNATTEYSISGGDGGFSFFDSDDANLKITMVYGNRYYIHVDENVYFTGIVNGLFVNPVAYDDQSNLLYSNTATSSYGGLYAGLKGRFYDSLEIVNVNPYLGKSNLGLDDISFVKLNAGITEAITGISLDKSTSGINKTAIIGTEIGEVYKVTGLPFSANTTRIDNGQLPYGYISSVDVGSNTNTVLVTISNFGLESVWVTKDGGANWMNLERNLPDMPVRWGRFDPDNDNRIIIATEMGIWSLENLSDVEGVWKSHNTGIPAIRVDMFDLRPSDKTILAATHGQGLFVGTYDDVPLGTLDQLVKKPFAFPNPTKNQIFIQSDFDVDHFEIIDLKGKRIIQGILSDNRSINLSSLRSGLFILKAFNTNGELAGQQKILVQ